MRIIGKYGYLPRGEPEIVSSPPRKGEFYSFQYWDLPILKIINSNFNCDPMVDGYDREIDVVIDDSILKREGFVKR